MWVWLHFQYVRRRGRRDFLPGAQVAAVSLAPITYTRSFAFEFLRFSEFD